MTTSAFVAVCVSPGHWRFLEHDIIRSGNPTRPRFWRVRYEGVELAKTVSKAEAVRWIRKNRTRGEAS